MTAFVLTNLSRYTSPVYRSASVSLSLSLRFFSNFTVTQLGINPTILDTLLHKHSFPPELASRVASELSHLRRPENANSILSFFKESEFSNVQLVKILKYKPRFLAASLEGSLKPKIKILQEVGFSSDDITKIISTNPKILELSVHNNIIPSLSVVKSLLGSCNEDEFTRVVRRAPRLLSTKFGSTLLPNVDFFKSCGIPMERIRIILSAYPSCFLMKPENVRKAAETAMKMGLDASSENFIYAISTIALKSSVAWELKLQAFKNMGFSDSDISAMFRKAPQAFSVSVEKINKVKELLLATGKFNLCSIASYPKSLQCSVEKRYIRRLRILETLESRNLIKNWPSLATVSMLPDDKFFNKFISPYSNEFSNQSSARGEKEISP